MSPSSETCRFCSSTGPAISLLECATFVNSDSDATLADVVSDIVHINLDLESVRKPLAICTQDCLTRLEECFRFRQQVRQAELALDRLETSGIKLEIIEEVDNQYDDAEFLDDGEEDREKINKFKMPPESLIVTRLEFEHFDYVEFRGERCCGCELICATRDELREHSGECHFSSEEVYEFGCAICKNGFPSSAQLFKHREAYSIKELLVCKLCQMIFYSKEALMTHMEESSDHQSVDDASEPADEVVEAPPAEGQDIEIEFAIPEAEIEADCVYSKLLPEEKLIDSFEDFEQYQVIAVIESAERCCACGVYFESFDQLLSHAEQEHHTDKNPSESEPFCEVCYDPFRSAGSLNTHKSLCRFVRKLFYCKLCQLVYTQRFQITKHFKNTPNHDQLPEEASKEQKRKRSSLEHIKTGFACCFLRCSAVFEQESQLMVHVEELHAPRRTINLFQRTSEEFVCAVCQRNFTSQQLLLLHRNRTLKKKHICSYCAEAFLIPSKLREHEQLVHSQSVPQHPCQICGKTFRTPNLLKAHQQTHDEKRDFSCDKCPARFKFRFQLRKHLNGVHPINFPFACSFCEKKFSVKEKHALHLRSHTGEKPYQCRFESCGKQFSHVTDRKRHEMGLHTGERPHRCEHCPAGFIRKRELLIHMQKHQGQQV